MADEQDRLRRQDGLAPLPTQSAAPIVDERTQAKAKTFTDDQLEAVRAQIEARDALTAAKQVNVDLAKKLGAKIDPATGKIDKTTIPKKEVGGKTVVSVTYEGTGKNRIKITKYSDGTETRESAPEDVGDGNDDDGGSGNIYTAPDGRIFTDLNAYNAYITKLKADEKLAKGESAFNIFRGFLAQYGLEGLAADVEKYKIEGLSDDELLIRLRTESTAYKNRFKANEARIKSGLRALSEAQYIELEDQYQDVMRRYGLPESYYTRGEMGRQEGFEKFIGGDVSSVELEDRIQTAQRRVLNADPQVKDALTQFYGSEISNGDILAYVLDPGKAIENIKRKVTAAEIGGGALRAGLERLSRGRAEELGQYGVTKETAQQGFGTIASGLERGRQLSKIYNQPDYTQAVAETEVFALPDADKARRQRRKLGQLETATFGGTSGATGGALSRERAGQY
jgi:hypothetical protein